MSRGHYFDEHPTVGSSRQTVELVLPDRTLTLVTDRGVFSAERVDPGTKLLLLEGRSVGADAGYRHLLDLGCGYGPIACTLGLRFPDSTVWAVDVNERARRLCAENAAAVGAGNVVVVEGAAGAAAGVPADIEFDAIWSNPPIRIGKVALHRLLAQWCGRLRPGGELWLVVAKNLGADPLARWLEEHGFAVERRRSRQGYRILVASGSNRRRFDPEEDEFGGRGQGPGAP